MLISLARVPVPSTTPDPSPHPPRDDDWLPAIAASDAELLNTLYRHRRPIETSLAGHKLAIATAACAPAQADAYAFALTVCGRPALLRVSASLVEICARSLSIEDFERLGPRQVGMLLELALLAPIKALESRLRTEIRVERRIDTIASIDAFVPLQLRVSGLPTIDASIEFFVDRQIVPAIASVLGDLAAPNSGMEQLPIPVRIDVGGADLTVAELRSLRPGDVILTDRDSNRAGATVAVVAERVRWNTERTASGFRVVSRLVGVRTDPAGVWFMQQPTDALQRPAVEEADLEQLPIRVVFEVGRLDMTLAEVRRLAPGYVLSLAKPSDTAVDIVANGRKIGHGSLLKIGDSIGVRVERLLSDD
jgi:type III secretion protein Q